MNPVQRFEDGLAATLARLGADGLLRQMRTPQGIDLVSNDYLGFAGHPYLTEAMRAALDVLPAGSGGSRLLRGHHPVFEQTEAALASFSGTESALLFGSGYAANIGLLQAIVAPGDLIVSDERNHASLIDGIRLTKAQTVIYPHQDLQALEDALKTRRSSMVDRPSSIVVTESVFSMDGDLTPLDEIVGIAERYGAVVLVDEAHATGLYGAHGSGRVEALGLRHRVLATVHTGGKSLGSAGAWVAGSRRLRDVMVNKARSFIFSTAPVPVLCAALRAGLELLEREPERRADVHRKSAALRGWLEAEGVSAGGESPIVPIVIGSNEAAMWVQHTLTACGFDVRAIRPPSVAPGTARLRVTVRYPIDDEDLRRFANDVGRLVHAGVR